MVFYKQKGCCIMAKKTSEAFDVFNEFFKNIKELGHMLSREDLDVAAESLRLAQKELEHKRQEQIEKEREAKRLEKERIKKERHDRYVAEVTSMDLPLDWENSFAGDDRAAVHTESIPDALILSLNNLGKVDIEYISQITGETCKTVIETLKGSIYQNPETWDKCFYKGWETADEYLTGNLKRKWKSAKKATKEFNGYFDANVEAIEKVIPPSIACEDIYVTLGSPWIPPDVIDDFIDELFCPCKAIYSGWNDYTTTKHDEITGTWEIGFKSRFNGTRMATKANSTYGTSRINALHIIERTLNLRQIRVTDSVKSPTSSTGEKRVVNNAETALAIEKQKKLINEFQKWIWKDEKRKERLEQIYEEKFACVRKRIFDGSFLEFPDMSDEIKLYPYQKNAVARILFTPNALLAHDVGAGKTYVMVAAGMEMRRMGISKKNLYVVPNNLVGQWSDIFLKMYPQANILCVEPKNFKPDKRDEVMEKIRDNDYDAVIMAYSCFELIGISREFHESQLEELLKSVSEKLCNGLKNTSRLQEKRRKLQEACNELKRALFVATDEIFFDELGINTLFVDEAHNFKNLPIETKIANVLGLSKCGSKKCAEMLEKVQCVQKQNNGRGVVLATGTPITNSVTDVYVMQKYLQSGELALLDLQSFDSWVGMFAEKEDSFEIDVDTSEYRMATRLSKFHNLPELTNLLASVADFHSMDGAEGIPEFDGYTDALIPKTKGFQAYLDQISDRVEDVRNHNVPRTDDNMLKITVDGRKAALDLRLAEPNAAFTYDSKVYRCAENVFDIYMKTYLQKSAQLIFCDVSTPKGTFNIYDELSRLLISMGIPEETIAYVHDAQTEKKRSELFRKVRNGEIRILLGSTFKLGLGVNVQDRLIALHHIDVPWRPADMVQREGRILRQGNMNPKVQIFRYITEGSFDAYSWQLLETKQRFISQLLSGSLTQRSGSDVDGTVLDYAEVKALAVGNPLIKKRVETANELEKYMALQRGLVSNREALENELNSIPAQLADNKRITAECVADRDFYQANKREYDKAQRQIIRKRIFDAVQNNNMIPAEKELLEYQGFKVILPANMLKEKPFVILKNIGRHYVNLGDTEVGTIIRIDNYLEGLTEYIGKLADAAEKLREKEIGIKAELAKDESYTDKIEELKKQLKNIDKKLGVKQ